MINCKIFRINWDFDFWTGGFNYLITILAKVVSGGFQDGQIQLRHGVWSDRRVALGQVVHQHASPFEAQHALVALVDESVVVCRGNLQNKKSNEVKNTHWRIGRRLALGTNFLLSDCRFGFCCWRASLSDECIRFMCSFSLSFRLNCLPQLAHKNSRWSECLRNYCIRHGETVNSVVHDILWKADYGG